MEMNIFFLFLSLTEVYIHCISQADCATVPMMIMTSEQLKKIRIIEIKFSFYCPG